jgi:hypothetical protein
VNTLRRHLGRPLAALLLLAWVIGPAHCVAMFGAPSGTELLAGTPICGAPGEMPGDHSAPGAHAGDHACPACAAIGQIPVAAQTGEFVRVAWTAAPVPAAPQAHRTGAAPDTPQQPRAPPVSV